MIKGNRVFVMLAAIAALSLMSAAPSAAQGEGQNVCLQAWECPNQHPPLDPSIKTTFVHVDNGEVGVLYEPKDPGPKAQIAVFVMHAGSDYLAHSACTELSKRGYRVFCVNNSTDKSKTTMADTGIMDKVLLQVKAAIVYLRKYPGVTKIVLWGHSGGAVVMTAYQDIAENGVKVCQDDAKIYKCPNSLAGLPPADGVILGDPNWGAPINSLINLDPSVSNDNGMKVNPDLDMFNPKNGFNPAGSHYSQEFIHKFQAAQAKRNNELIDLALSRMAAIKAGKGQYSDDEPFIIAGALGAIRPYATDMSLFEHTQKAWPLLHPDGSITTEVVHSVRVPTATQDPSNTFIGGALKTTVTSFLMCYAIRITGDFGYGADDTIRGVQWNSSWTNNPGNAEGITVPFLTMGMTGGHEAFADATIHNHVKSADKTNIYVEGALHGYATCKACEKTPGQFGDTIKTLYDYADGWLSKPGRFL